MIAEQATAVEKQDESPGKRECTHLNIVFSLGKQFTDDHARPTVFAGRVSGSRGSLAAKLLPIRARDNAGELAKR